MPDTLTNTDFDPDAQADYYHAHAEELERIVGLLTQVRRRIENYADPVAKSILFEADLFAVLSVSTVVDAHELAFEQCLDAIDDGADSETLADIIGDVRGPETNMAVQYHNYKADYVENLLTHVDYDRQLELFRDDRMDALHAYKREHVDGLGTVKSAFALSMCGVMEKPCIDGQFARNLGFDVRYFNRVIVDTYHDRVQEARDRTHEDLDHLEPFAWQWVTWDYIRDSDTLTTHDTWFDRTLGITA